MRIFRDLRQAFSESERTLWEAGQDDGDIKIVAPWVLQVIDTRGWAAFYKDPEGGPELYKLLEKQLVPAIDVFKEVYESAAERGRPGKTLSFQYIFPDSPTELERKTILNRFLFESNGEINIFIHSLNCDLYRQLSLNWAMSLHFAKLFAKANDLGLGHLYHTIINLHETTEKLSSKKIF